MLLVEVLDEVLKCLACVLMRCSDDYADNVDNGW